MLYTLPRLCRKTAPSRQYTSEGPISSAPLLEKIGSPAAKRPDSDTGHYFKDMIEGLAHNNCILVDWQ